MKDIYTRYSIETASEEQAAILVAFLDQMGIEGFEEQENLLIASGKTDELDADYIESYLSKNDIKYSKSTIKNENWNAVWEANFEPVRVENFVGIRADFHEPIANVAHEIVITPKMSFGTGHHATTWMMLMAMKAINFKGAEVFDFGTGTGILAIMAQKLGAAKVLALDYDDWCIENAAENFERNDCGDIQLEKADSAKDCGHFSVILANINKNVIIDNLRWLEDALEEDGNLILSGLLLEDEQEVLDLLVPQQFGLVKKFERNGWIALHLHKQMRG